MKREHASKPGGEGTETRGSMGPWTEVIAGPAVMPKIEDDIVTELRMPRFALPNVSSLLPEYTNSEQDFIHRTFHKGNYDMIRSLPGHVEEHEVTRSRRCRMERAHKHFSRSVKSDGSRKDALGKATNGHGLFSGFEYIPSRYSLVDELRSKERVESESKRMEVSGEDFQYVGTLSTHKCDDAFEPGVPYPYLSDPYEAMDEKKLLEKWEKESRILYGPFTSPGCEKLPDAPTKTMQEETIQKLKAIILEDWPSADLQMYPNEEGMWVMRFGISSVESEFGLTAYMNILVRCNSIINKYNLVKVVENWNVKPGDEYVYFTVRPPWVRHETCDAFFCLHPEERSYKTLQAFKHLISQHSEAAPETRNDRQHMSDFVDS